MRVHTGTHIPHPNNNFLKLTALMIFFLFDTGDIRVSICHSLSADIADRLSDFDNGRNDSCIVETRVWNFF